MLEFSVDSVHSMIKRRILEKGKNNQSQANPINLSHLFFRLSGACRSSFSLKERAKLKLMVRTAQQIEDLINSTSIKSLTQTRHRLLSTKKLLNRLSWE